MSAAPTCPRCGGDTTEAELTYSGCALCQREAAENAILDAADDAFVVRKRRPDWIVALAMLAGALVVALLVVWTTYPANWGAILAGVCAVPGAFVGGVLATLGEHRG